MTALKIIARVRSDFPTKFGIPRQSNLVADSRATIVFEPEYQSPDALRGLEDFSHIWLIWGFSEAERDAWSPTVRPPRLGGNTRMGVFATRSPYRPNPIGLSSVRVAGIERHPRLGPVVHVLGADCMDGTPVYDIKPYIPYADCHPDAVGGFAGAAPIPTLEVDIAGCWLALLPAETAAVLREVLAYDPRPPYQRDPDRVYGLEFGGFEVKFSVVGRVLTVTEITPAKPPYFSFEKKKSKQKKTDF